MFQDDTIKKLTQISTVKVFKTRECICYEGQPGTEMYIILQGTVGVYVSGPSGSHTEVSRMSAGDFFGEMAIFDHSPRSASCIALEDVVCVAVTQEKLLQFVATCPDITIKVLKSLSERIRRLNDALYKNSAHVSEKIAIQFEIPTEYSRSHKIIEPRCDMKFLEHISAPCPICGETVTLSNPKKHLMTPKNVSREGRVNYKECDPIWYSVWTCPHCRYSNFYSLFFRISSLEKEAIRKMLQEQQIPVLTSRTDLDTPFDHLFVRYLQAIHINQGNHLMSGRLWLNLYWLFSDAGDQIMRKYCAKKATDALACALNENAITEEETRLSVQLAMTSMYAVAGDTASTVEVCNIILRSDGHHRLKKLARDLQIQYKL